MAYADDFGPFDDHVWLNCAHQGPLPKVALEAGHEALRQKSAPHRLSYPDFDEVPQRLKTALARLVGCDASEIVLGNSTSYGLNLLVQGLPLREGDEVLLVDGDFPATVITWLPLRERGINVRLFKPTQWPPTPEEIAAEFTEKTRVFCSSWVFSFRGSAIDAAAVGEACRQRDVLFVLNASQALGARPIDIASLPVDCLVSCGFKWLCGPYATGFAWFRPEVLASLTYRQAYWVVHADRTMASYDLRSDVGAEDFDVFAPANFLNVMPWTASVEYLLEQDIGAIEKHDQSLVDRAVDGIDAAGYRLVSPRRGPERSTLVLFSHADASRNAEIYEQLWERGIHLAERDGKLRIAPHLYNTTEDIDRAIDALAQLA